MVDATFVGSSFVATNDIPTYLYIPTVNIRAATTRGIGGIANLGCRRLCNSSLFRNCVFYCI